MKDLLIRMVGMITPNFAMREDLLQEGLIHLWLTETRRPGQTRSWYLQSSRFHLLHYLGSGRSVDSPKRGRGHMPVVDDSDQAEELPALVDPGDSVLSQVSARDIISLLSTHLSLDEHAVLDGLADGFGMREIGRRLKMSHTMVMRHRSKIASLLIKFEGPAFPGEKIRKVLGTANSKKANGVRHRERARNASAAKCSVGLVGCYGHSLRFRPRDKNDVSPKSCPAFEGNIL